MKTSGSVFEKVIADEGNLRALIDSTEDPIWLIDTQYTILECNAAFGKWVSCFIETVIGKGDNVLYGGENIPYHNKFEMCYKLALSGKTFRSVEDMNVNGELRYTSVTFTPVFDTDNIVVGVSCFARDITEHRKHLFKIELQNEVLREIAFIESHKIRGPVATILGLEQFYNYNDPADPVNREIMEGIKLVSHELDDIIREVVRLTNAIKD
jgi:PAS domain S-box-containing protein